MSCEVCNDDPQQLAMFVNINGQKMVGYKYYRENGYQGHGVCSCPNCTGYGNQNDVGKYILDRLISFSGVKVAISQVPFFRKLKASSKLILLILLLALLSILNR